MSIKEHFRLLVVDDEDSILNMFKKIFATNGQSQDPKAEMKSAEAELFTKVNTSAQTLFSYDLTYCKQGEEAVEEVRRSNEEDNPFSVVFLDMRLPPGKNGLWTAEKIRDIDPDIHIVVVTGYSDVEPAELNVKVPPANHLLFVRKPVVPQEIRQFADSLSKNWLENRETKALLESIRAEALNNDEGQSDEDTGSPSGDSENKLNSDLHSIEITELQESLDNLKHSLKQEIGKLSEANALIERQEKVLKEHQVAIKVLSNKFNKGKELDDEIQQINRRITFNILEIATPYIEKLEDTNLEKEQRDCLNVLKKNLGELAKPGMQNLATEALNFSSTEVKIINLIRHGKTSKEIATFFNLSPRTIEYHRRNIRKKFGLTESSKTSLGDHLRTITF